MHVVGVMSYDKHDLIRELLMEHLRKTYQRDGTVTISCVDLEADEEIFVKMAEVAEDHRGIQLDGRGLPLDWIVLEVLDDLDIRMLVGPRRVNITRGGGEGGSCGADGAGAGKGRGKGRIAGQKRKAQRQRKSAKFAAYECILLQIAASKGEGGGKEVRQKGKGGGVPPPLAPHPVGRLPRRIPKMLPGMNVLAANGEGKCFSWSTGDESRKSKLRKKSPAAKV